VWEDEDATLGKARRPGALTGAEIFRRASPSVFVVEILDAGGSLIATGSGVAVGIGQVITNKHVTSRGNVRLRHGEHTWIPLRVVNDSVQDLAVLVVDHLAARPSPLESLTAVGDRVYAIGAPEGLELTMSDGLISGIRAGVIQTSAPLSSGSSGGGLFDQHGRLVGITTSSLREGQNLNFAVPIGPVVSLLASTATAPPQSLPEVLAEIDGVLGTPPVAAAPRAPNRSTSTLPKTDPRLTAPAPLIVRSLPNATDIIEPWASAGRGILSVVNGTDRDATVKLVAGSRVRRWIYVKAKSTAAIEGMEVGSYRVLFSLGTDWSAQSHRFMRDRSFRRFEDEFGFSETPVAGGGIEYDRLSITLNAVPRGNARTEKIDETEFEGLSTTERRR
jgi:hypothetical protein